MGENSIKESFLDFGKNMKSLAVLSVIYSIGVVINFFAIFSGVFTFLFWPGDITPAAVVFLIVNMLSNVCLVIIDVFLIRVYVTVKKINKIFNNISLRTFGLYLVMGIIASWVGEIGALIYVPINKLTNLFGFYLLSISPIALLFLGLNFLAFGSLIGYILKGIAWKNMEEFFRFNLGMFPDKIGVDLTMASKMQKMAYTISCLGFFSFLFIPIPGLIDGIAVIFSIRGYLNLGISFQKMKSSGLELLGIPKEFNKLGKTQPMRSKIDLNSEPKFCGKCGSPIDYKETFCTTCGTKILSDR